MPYVLLQQALFALYHQKSNRVNLDEAQSEQDQSTKISSQFRNKYHVMIEPLK